MPRLSVVMPVYNARPFVADAVASILGQTYRDLELIVVDDGSTDGSVDELQRFDDPRLVISQLPRNAGIARALDHGLSLAQGELIGRMDADDVALPQRLECQLKLIDEASVDVCGTWARRLGRPNAVLRQPVSNEAIRAKLRFSCALFHPTVVLRRSTLDAGGGGYLPEWVPSEDFELWVRLARDPSVRFANLPEPLLDYRIIDDARPDYERRQSAKASEVAVAEARRTGIIDDSDCARSALVSIARRRPPAPDGWGDVAAMAQRFAALDSATSAEVAERWEALLRRAPLRNLFAVVRAARVFGPKRMARAFAVVCYGAVRRRPTVVRAVRAWRSRGGS